MNFRGIDLLPHRGLEWLALLASCVLCLILVSYPMFDFDFYWHLANGREMVNQGRIISEEVFSYTHAGEHFANHEWLGQIIFYLVWKTFGPIGLFVMKLFIVTLISSLLFLSARIEKLSPVIALLLTVLVILAGLNRYHVRPELFSLFYMASLSFILYGYCLHKVSRRLLWLVPLIMVTWDWLHGAVFGLAFLGLFVTGENIKYRVKWLRHQSTLAGNELKYLNICFAVTLLAMLVNPFGLRSYSIFVGYVTGEANFNSVITEFTPMTWEFSKVFFLMFGWMVLLLLRNWRQADVTQAITGIVFGLAAFRFSRMGGAAAIVMLPVIARLLHLSMQDSRALVERRFHWGSLAVIASLMLWYSYIVKFSGMEAEADDDVYHYVKVYDLSLGYKMAEDVYPVGIVNFIKAHDLRGNLYNSGNLGGYLSYYITPERKIFQYNMGRVFGDPLYYTRHPDSLKKWHIDYAIVGTEMEMSLFPDKEWATVYRDQAAVLLVRRTPEHAKLIAENEIYLFSPVLSNTSLLKQVRDSLDLLVLSVEMERYLAFRQDKRIATLLAGILGKSAELRHNAMIQTLLGKVLKYNPVQALRDLYGD